MKKMVQFGQQDTGMQMIQVPSGSISDSVLHINASPCEYGNSTSYVASTP